MAKSQRARRPKGLTNVPAFQPATIQSPFGAAISGPRYEDWQPKTTEEAVEELNRLHSVVFVMRERHRLLLANWHRPIAPSGKPCVCVGCEDLAAAAQEYTEQ